MRVGLACLGLAAIPHLASAQPVVVAQGTAEAPYALHRGMTFEGGLGVGFAHIDGAFDVIGTYDSDAAFAFDFGAGTWLTPRLAVTGRIASVVVANGANDTYVHSFIGPNIEYWLDPQFRVGAGVGLASYRQVAGHSCMGDCTLTGWGLDLRAGYVFTRSDHHSFDASLEVTPGFFTSESHNSNWTGIVLVLGYQYL
jgi:hypothetical protein